MTVDQRCNASLVGQRNQALEYLLGRIDYERQQSMPYSRRELRLDRMRELLARLGNPQDALWIVHVAGTKGKGSTAAMIAAVLTAAGYRTGLYSSPHLDQLEERFLVDGCICEPQEFVELVDSVRPAVAAIDEQVGRTGRFALGPTYFEITTALGLLHFARRGVHTAVVEVGMGGRLDSTNVCMPVVSVVTSISFDHMKQLGVTLEAIAREKAGIIKPGVPVVSGVVEDEPRTVVDEVRQANGCTLAQLGRDFRTTYHPPRNLECEPALGIIDFKYEGPRAAHRFERLPLGLLGAHQAANAAVALATLAELRHVGWTIDESAIRRGLADVRWPARVEVVARRPTVVIDAAHNTASIASLLETLGESFQPSPRLLVFATTQEKQVAEMLQLLLPRFDGVIFTRYQNNPRGVPVEELAKLASSIRDTPCWLCATPADAWVQLAQLVTPQHLVCVTGSFFLAAELREAIRECPLPTCDGQFSDNSATPLAVSRFSR